MKDSILQTYFEIWDNSIHACMIYPEISLEFSRDVFSHILPKQSYTDWADKKENIVLLSPLAHKQWHDVSRSILTEEGNKKPSETAMNWRTLFELRDQLTEEYHRTH